MSLQKLQLVNYHNDYKDTQHVDIFRCSLAVMNVEMKIPNLCAGLKLVGI